MPRYDGECLTCGTVEIVKGMNDPWPVKCPQCKGNGFTRIFTCGVAFHAPADSGWDTKNGGLGEWMPQLGKRYLDGATKTQPNPDAYARSRSEAIDKFKRRGYPNIEKC
jgi:putative FmdB family regulatory protein